VGETDCIEMPGFGAARTRSLTFALTDWIDPGHLPTPRNESEAILFRHLYETPFEIDCRGDVAEGLVTEWQSRDDGRTWVLYLRQDARFTDGSPVTAEEVKRCWMQTRRAIPAAERSWIWDVVRPSSVQPTEDGGLVVQLDEARDLPDLLARPEFFVFREDPEGWPLGTRGLRAETRPQSGRSGVHMVTCHDSTDALVTTFEILQNGDSRDVIAPGVDAAVVRGRAALRFLERFPDVRLTPLPWDRLYLLLSPHRDRRSELPPEIRDELARDVTGSDARAATSWLLAPRSMSPPAWPTDDLVLPPGSPTGEMRIVMPRRDDDASRLAERIAFLWTEADPSIPVRVAPLAPRDFRDSLRRGDEAAYVVPVARGTAAADLQLRDLLDRAPWLAGPETIVPLVETRAHLVSRKQLTGVVTGYEGTPLLHGAGWAGSGDAP
jgi:hypothetical protein